jgi:hypothetical protein
MKVRKYEVLHDAVRLYPYRGEPYDVPFVRMQPRPTRSNPIVEIGWEPDVGRHGPAYELKDGQKGAVLWDHALSVNDDPDYRARVQEHRLRAELQGMLREAASGKSVRQLAKQLGTSTSQVVRLLDPDRGGSLDSLARALFKLGVDLEVRAA